MANVFLDICLFDSVSLVDFVEKCGFGQKKVPKVSKNPHFLTFLDFWPHLITWPEHTGFSCIFWYYYELHGIPLWFVDDTYFNEPTKFRFFENLFSHKKSHKTENKCFMWFCHVFVTFYMGKNQE